MIHPCALDDLPAVRWGLRGIPIAYGPRAGRSHGEALALARLQGARLATRRLLSDRQVRGDAARRRTVAPRSAKPLFSPGLTTAYETLLHDRVELAERLFLEYAGPAIAEAQRELDARRGDARRMDASAWQTILSVLRVVREAAFGAPSKEAEGLRYLATQIAEESTDGTDRQLSRLFNVPLATAAGGQDKVDRWIVENAALIKSLSGGAIGEVEKMVAAAASGGQPTLDLLADIKGRFGVSYSKASLIARDQTAKLGSRISQSQMQRYGVSSYQWSTSGDSRVRQEHADLDGRIFQWSDPPIADKAGTRGHPGEVWQCRCVALAILPDDNVVELLAQAEARQERELLILQASPTVQGQIPNRSGFSDWNAARIAELRRGARSAVGL